jgi:hypothetical protein
MTREQLGAKGEGQVFSGFDEVRIAYDQGAAELSFYVEGELVSRETGVPRMESFIAALGLMTEKDILDGRSVSCHGQGLSGQWSPLTITTRGP